MTESFKLDDVWEEIQKRAEDRAEWDLSQPDLPWEEAQKLGMRYVDWVLRRETHERHRKGLSVPNQRAQFEGRFTQILEAQ